MTISYDVERDYISRKEFEGLKKLLHKRSEILEEEHYKHEILLEALSKQIMLATDLDDPEISKEALQRMRKMIDEFTEHGGELPGQYVCMDCNEMWTLVEKIGSIDWGLEEIQ